MGRRARNSHTAEFATWPTGSGSAVRESAMPDEVLRRAGLAILRALKWHGVAMVEFLRRPDGALVFMEVNGRFWNSLPLAVYAGRRFPGDVGGDGGTRRREGRAALPRGRSLPLAAREISGDWSRSGAARRLGFPAISRRDGAPCSTS